jgi:hypothetical protein
MVTKTVDSYLGGLPAERRAVISAVRDVVLENLPKRVRRGDGVWNDHVRCPAIPIG